MEDFEYVVNRPEPARIFFGSTIVRDVLPLSGPAMNSFMRRITPEPHNPILGPSRYNTSYFRKASHPILKKVIC